MTTLEVIPRTEFVENRFAYSPGEHVLFLAPTQQGKTTLAYDLIAQVATEKLQAVSLVMKPRDKVVRAKAKTLNHQVVRTWPPVWTPWDPTRKPGYVMWPKHTGDADGDDANLSVEFRKTMRACYMSKKNYILFADEIAGLVSELGLKKSCSMLWMRGSSMGTGLWAATQRPVDIPLYAYSAPTHLFLSFDRDKRNRDRFSEIGGVDPDLVKETVLNLKQFQWLYIRKSTSKLPEAMCIIDRD